MNTSCREVYLQFAHLDRLLSDPKLAENNDPLHRFAHAAWAAIKNDLLLKGTGNDDRG